MTLKREYRLVAAMAALSGSLACEGVTETETQNSQVTETQAALSTGEYQNTVRILVHPRIYAALTNSLNTLAADMRAEGWTATIAQFASSRAADLKDYLKRDYAATGGRLAGALLIGDLPWVKCIDSWHESRGICDYWYMDLDGDWRDTDQDGAYDYLGAGSGDREPEIFVGRLNASSLDASLNSSQTSLLGKNEVQLLKDYLNRDHRFRKGWSVGNQKSQMSLNEGQQYEPDFAAMISSQSALFPETRVLAFQTDGSGAEWLASNPSVRTTGPVGKTLMLDDWAQGLNFAFVDSHGWPGGYAGKIDAMDVVELALAGRNLPLFIDTHSCTTAALDVDNSMAALTTMGGSLGYIGAGAEMYYPGPWDVTLTTAFAQQNKSIGEALKTMHNSAFANVPDGATSWTTILHLLVGDPTLRRTYPAATSPDPDFVNTNQLEVWLADGASDDKSTSVKLFVKNVGTTAVSLSGVVARYEISVNERAGLTPVVDDYYTPGSTPRLVSAATTLRPNAWYVELQFGDTMLGPGQSSSNGTNNGGEQVRIHSADWQTPWYEYNDYSAAGKTGSWAVTRNVNLYRSGTLIYGFRR